MCDELDGAKRESLRMALLKAYRNEDSFRMLLDSIDQNLDEIATEGNYTTRVADTIQEASNNGWIDDLVRKAIATKPRNKELPVWARENCPEALHEAPIPGKKENPWVHALGVGVEGIKSLMTLGRPTITRVAMPAMALGGLLLAVVLGIAFLVHWNRGPGELPSVRYLDIVGLDIKPFELAIQRRLLDNRDVVGVAEIGPFLTRPTSRTIVFQTRLPSYIIEGDAVLIGGDGSHTPLDVTEVRSEGSRLRIGPHRMGDGETLRVYLGIRAPDGDASHLDFRNFKSFLRVEQQP